MSPRMRETLEIEETKDRNWPLGNLDKKNSKLIKLNFEITLSISLWTHLSNKKK